MAEPIDVVVPVYGGWALTESCLTHLRAQTAAHRVILVDNASPDDTLARVRAGFPDVEIVAMGRNAGFAAACNAGIRSGSGEIIVLLNNDVDAPPDLLAQLTEPFARDARLGSAAPLLLRPDGQVDSLGLCCDVTLTGFARLAGTDAQHAARATRPQLLGPSGACGAYRRAALDGVGPLDEAIFMYSEDLDLALRLRAAGWGTAAVPAARAVHHGSATVGRRSAQQRRWAGFARGHLIRKYGLLRSRPGVRTLLSELLACAGDAVLARDLAAVRGRASGLRSQPSGRAATPAEGVDRSIGVREAFALRRAA
ncbi:unannotated protein [freshwater metagenome]|uniref:Unannotated protein n=1 Tax=freshwater metagenome TaxID=449393 RepID=A0A6J7D4N0_9ZZZZ|nr:glycosyltransferase [Actinomycetota bacterium]